MTEKKQKARKCPWCGEEVSESKVSILKKTYGDVRERRCPNCGEVLAAYLEQEGEFMKKMRSY